MKMVNLVTLLLLFGCFGYAHASVNLPAVWSDGVILQRDVQVPLWGWADAGEKITVEFKSRIYRTVADADGKWSILLSKMGADTTASRMEIKGANALIINDVLVGDVWLCSGQSNMAWTMKESGAIYEAEMRNCKNRLIRQFSVRRVYSFKPEAFLQSDGWSSATPENVLSFTAVGYFFAKKVFEKYRVPVGLINASWGGTPLEAWTAENGFLNFPEYRKKIISNTDSLHVRDLKRYETETIAAWDKNLAYTIAKRNTKFSVLYPESSDRSIQMPSWFEQDPTAGNTYGVVWLFKDFYLENLNKVSKVSIYLGRIAENDSTYINGHRVGFTNGKYNSRIYDVPLSYLRAGKNIISIRVVNREARIGIEKRANHFNIMLDTQKVSLNGTWKYRVEIPQNGMQLDRTNFPGRQPSVIFNGMIAPLIPFSIKGVIWYQGEDNIGRAKEYGLLFPAMIESWRKEWEKDFSFLYVQLPSHKKPSIQPSESRWAELREAQSKALGIKKTAMTVNYDLGESDNIHPPNKKEFGDRLAYLAFEKVYKDRNTQASGPFFRKMKIKSNKAILFFKREGANFASGSAALQYFAIAGADRKFVFGDARISGKKIIVQSRDIKKPVAVRYAWSDNPKGANLRNDSNLPVPPFRSDNWPAEIK